VSSIQEPVPATGTVATGSGAEPTPAPEPAAPRTRYPAAVGVALVSIALLLAGVVWSVGIGPTPMSIGTIVGAVLLGGHSTSAVIVHGIRLPRAVLGMLVGANSAVSGTIMQNVTANPLGAPDILGINAGAAFVAVASLTFVPQLAGFSLITLAFVGATACGVLVLLTAGVGRGRSDPVRIALAGVTLTTLVFSVMQAMIIFTDPATDALFHWLVGGVNEATWHDITTILPWTVLGLIGAMALAGKLNLLGLGEDLARGLGARVGQIRVIGSAIVVILAGSAVAVAGPVAFIGLIVPHIVRRLVGVNNYVVIPLCTLIGANMLVYADIVSRYIDPPSEVPSGVVTALIGAPVFIYLARRQKARR
jgi:iron complex transport system permease protein